MRVQWGWIQRGFVLGVIAGGVLSCSSTASEQPDARQPVSTGDTNLEAGAITYDAVITTSDAAIVDSEIDVCSLPDACPTPIPADASADGSVVDPHQCPSLDTYCSQHTFFSDPALSSAPSCGPVQTWPEAVAYFCVHDDGVGRYLNCNGYNAIVFGSIEFSTIFYFDSTTLALVAIATGGPYMNTLRSSQSFPYGCVAGSSVPDVDPATCESYATGPCQ